MATSLLLLLLQKVDQKQAQDMEFSSETLLLLLFSTLLLLANIDAILLQVPLHEPHQKAFHPASESEGRMGIDLDDRVLQQGLRANQLVARGVVNHLPSELRRKGTEARPES